MVVTRIGPFAIAISVCLAALCAWTAAPSPRGAADEPNSVADDTRDVFAEYLLPPLPPADGFDLPIGDGDGGGSYQDARGKTHHGWYVATEFGEEYALGIHPGEDWNGRGGGNTDLGQPVYAIGHGRVVEAGTFADPFGGIVILEHVFYENAGQRTVRSVYIHLSRIDVEPGALVTRRQLIGAIGRDPGGAYPAHLHLEIRTNRDLQPTHWPSSNGETLEDVRRSYLDPSDFILARRTLPIPANEPSLLIAHHGSHRMRRYIRGVLEAEYEIAFGQAAGAKELRGDLKTPVGMYFVIQKSTGPFTGDYADFYGGHWIKVNYPNALDADRGLDAGLITRAQRDAIASAWRSRRATAQNTKLGGGIGFHGWIDTWDGDGGAYLSWGCVVMHNEDIEALFPEVPVGTMVVLLE